jgi:hypothetical protein
MDKLLIFIEKKHFRGQIPEVLKYFCKDIPATSTANLSAINRNTVQRIFTLLRDKIVDMASAESKPFVGDIEVDESYFGPRRVRGKRERGASGKIPVLGLHKRQGTKWNVAEVAPELTDLKRTRSGVQNLNVAVREWTDQIIFLRKIFPGRADQSYGIQVARPPASPARSSPAPRKSSKNPNSTPPDNPQ